MDADHGEGAMEGQVDSPDSDEENWVSISSSEEALEPGTGS